MKRLLALIFTFSTLEVSSQDINVSAYLETYYGYDFNKPSDHERPAFVYSHNRHNELNLNLGYIKATYDKGKVRSALAVMAGTYANANLAAEPGVLKNIFEANAGFRLSESANLWIDAGIFASHIGFESAVSKDCWTLTRSILAENSPYYESGAKLTYISDNNKWLLSGLFLNGWQHIQRPQGNNTPAFGTQITFTPNPRVKLNYSTFTGNDQPDELRQMRYFHNFYGIFQIADKVHLITGFDFGSEQKSRGSSDYNQWYSPVLIVKMNLNEKWAAAGRWEYYSDSQGVIIDTGTPNGFETTGLSLNIDYSPMSNAILRLEGKVYDSKDKVFIRDITPVNHSSTLTASMAVSF